MAKIPTASIASPRRGGDDLEVLHAALDSRLAALEAALADPNEFELEGLILDLARATTEEAEAVARRASMQARADADAQAGNALSQAQMAEAALASERHAGLELHRSLGAARSELEASKQKMVALTNELERLRDAFSIERSTLRAELSEAERCFAAADTRRQQVEETRDEEVARERATVQRLTDALAKARGEIDAARQDVASRAADMEAARERAEKATRSVADLTQTLNEVRARVDAVGQERDRLKTELEATRQNAASSVQSAATERTAIEQKWREAETRVTAVTNERDRIIGERDRLGADRERLSGEKDRLNGERDRLAKEREKLTGEKDRLTAERDRLTKERDRLTAEKERLAKERDQLVKERDAVGVQLETARQGAATAAAAAQAIETQRASLDQALRDAENRHQVVARERDAILTERDAALATREALIAERDAAHAKRDAVEAERNAAMTQLEAARQGSDTANAALQSRLQSLERERDEAVAQRDAAVTERADAVAGAEAFRKAVDEAQEASRARFSELRQRTERQIQDLEAQFVSGAVEDGPEVDVSLDDADEPGAAIELDVAETTVSAAKPSRRAQITTPGAFSPSRRANRHAFREPLEVKLDDETALLVDLSTIGAQVLSSSALKPNKAVKMQLPSADAIILCKAKIIWSRFEPPTPGKPVRYRAGMVFTQADAAALHVFISRHKGMKATPAVVAPPPAVSEDRKTGRLISVPFTNAAAGGRSRRADSREPIASLDFNFPAKQRRD